MLSQRTIDILEKNDIHVFDREEQHEQFYRDIEFYSPENEDVYETIWYDGTDEGFIEAFRINAENFDPDEHAELWIESRGTNGVPSSIRDLIEDADWIKNTLLDVAGELL